MYMVCIWYVYGMYMVCIWYVYGMYMVCIWYVYGMYMVCIWYVYGMYMVCIWYVYGMYVFGRSVWHICWQFMHSIWRISGVCSDILACICPSTINTSSTVHQRSTCDPKNTKTLNTIERTMVPNIPLSLSWHLPIDPQPWNSKDWFPFGSLGWAGAVNAMVSDWPTESNQERGRQWHTEIGHGQSSKSILKVYWK